MDPILLLTGRRHSNECSELERQTDPILLLMSRRSSNQGSGLGRRPDACCTADVSVLLRSRILPPLVPICVMSLVSIWYQAPQDEAGLQYELRRCFP